MNDTSAQSAASNQPAGGATSRRRGLTGLHHAPHHHLFYWAAHGQLRETDRRVLAASGLLPEAGDWRRFINGLLLWFGVVMIAAGFIFFLAFNWQAMGRFAKFALAEVALALPLAYIGWRSLTGHAGQAAIVAAALCTGALFALIGQTYQTGADTWELFFAWSIAIIPWALLGRLPVLWLLWLGLVNLTLGLYIDAIGGVFNRLIEPQQQVWLFWGLNTLTWLLWETLAHHGVDWLRPRWAPRILAFASGSTICSLAIYDIIGPNMSVAIPVFLLWLSLMWVWFRYRAPELFMLAGGTLAALLFSLVLLGRLLPWGGSGSLLFMALATICLSGLAAQWLRKLAHELAADDEADRDKQTREETQS